MYRNNDFLPSGGEAFVAINMYKGVIMTNLMKNALGGSGPSR